MVRFKDNINKIKIFHSCTLEKMKKKGHSTVQDQVVYVPWGAKLPAVMPDKFQRVTTCYRIWQFLTVVYFSINA